MPATYDDANLLVQIIQWGSMEGIGDAIAELHSDDFDADKATLDDAPVRKVLNFGEVVGTFVKQGVLDRGLVLDMWAVDMMWKRVGPAAIKSREHSGEARLYENFEALVRGVPSSVSVKGSAVAAGAPA